MLGNELLLFELEEIRALGATSVNRFTSVFILFLNFKAMKIGFYRFHRSMKFEYISTHELQKRN